LINVKRAIYSKHLRQPYIIHRKLGNWEAGRLVQIEFDINTLGPVTVASPRELMQLPEGDRVAGTMIFHCPEELYVTHTFEYTDTDAPGTSDELEWEGDRYRVTTTFPWKQAGYYKAFAVYMEGD
jgi:hypothetical protein